MVDKVHENIFTPLKAVDAPRPYQELGPEPDQAVTPFIFSVPHSGRYYPADFVEASSLGLHSLRASEDAYVDMFASPLAAFRHSVLIANYARSYVDLNRDAAELDPTMFNSETALPVFKESHRVRAGLGCIPRVAGPGLEIYGAPLDAREIEKRLNAAYYPFHGRLAAHIKSRIERYGEAIVIDCHSMPAPPTRRGGQRPWPEIVLGDCWGSSCKGDLTDAAERQFLRSGFSVRRNTPYAGGYLCQHYGAPARGVHVLQIEINRAAYMNEHSLAPHTRFDSIKERIANSLAALAGGTQIASQAAE